MKRVIIKYRKVRLNEVCEVSARTNDLAIRKMMDNNGKPIHVAGGRLSQSALLKRAQKTNIVILSIKTNGKVNYEGDEEAAAPTTATTPIFAQDIDKLKFMFSRFNGTCKETGRKINKHDTILYDRSTKSVYCNNSDMFNKHKDITSIYGQGIVKPNESAEVTAEPTPVVEEANVIEEAIKPVEETAATPVKATRSQSASTDKDRMLYDTFVAPFIDDFEIDDDALNAKVEQAVKKYVRRIEISHTDTGETVTIEGQHKDFDRLYKYCLKRKNVLLVGAAGTGKTHAAGEIARLLKLDYATISVNLATQKHEFFGYMEATGKYVSTPFRKLFENGGVFLLDEFDAGNANALTAINMASSNSSVTFPDGHIKKHKDFVLVASANTFGLGANYEYVGRNKLDAATRNRFAKMFWDYDEVMELMLTPNERWTKYCQAIRRTVAELKIKDVIVSIRQMKDGGDMLEVMDRADVEQDYLWSDMKASDVSKIREKVQW